MYSERIGWISAYIFGANTIKDGEYCLLDCDYMIFIILNRYSTPYPNHIYIFNSKKIKGLTF